MGTTKIPGGTIEYAEDSQRTSETRSPTRLHLCRPQFDSFIGGIGGPDDIERPFAPASLSDLDDRDNINIKRAPMGARFLFRFEYTRELSRRCPRLPTTRQRDKATAGRDKSWKASAYDWARDRNSVLIEMAKSTPYPR